MLYHIRIDKASEEIIDYLTTISTKYIYASEDVRGKNPHTHFCVETKTPQQTIRNHIRSGGYKKGEYSISTVRTTVSKMVVYIMKDGEYFSKGFDEDFLEECKNETDKINEDKKKKKKSNVYQTLLEHCQDLKGCKDPSYVMRRVVDYHIENDLMLRRFMLISYCDTIMCKISPFYKQMFIQDLLRYK